MRVTSWLYRLWIISIRMSTAIAYSFMTMDNEQRTRERRDKSRRSSEYPSTKYNNPGYDNSSESAAVALKTASAPKRRQRKRSSSGSRTAVKPKVKVNIVIQFFKVGEIDTLKEQFNADVIIKAKWREPQYDGQSSLNETLDFNKLWNPKLYIENSLGDPKEQIRHRLIFNDKGEAFIYEKRIAKGTFMENLELDDFPFDVQDLTITVASELPSSEVELVEDKDEHHVVNRQSFVDEQEWHLYVHTECTTKELVIDQADNSVKRSALSVKCRAARRPGYFVWNIFMITFLICSLAFATFSVEKNKPENRLQLSFTLVLTAVAFKSVVNSSLPRISYLTYMDKYLLASMVMLSGICSWHAIVTRLLDDRAYADKVEGIVLTILGVIYFLYNLGFLFMIYLFPCKKRRVMAQKDREYKRLLMGKVGKGGTTGNFKILKDFKRAVMDKISRQPKASKPEEEAETPRELEMGTKPRQPESEPTEIGTDSAPGHGDTDSGEYLVPVANGNVPEQHSVQVEEHSRRFSMPMSSTLVHLWPPLRRLSSGRVLPLLAPIEHNGGAETARNGDANLIS